MGDSKARRKRVDRQTRLVPACKKPRPEDPESLPAEEHLNLRGGGRFSHCLISRPPASIQKADSTRRRGCPAANPCAPCSEHDDPGCGRHKVLVLKKPREQLMKLRFGSSCH